MAKRSMAIAPRVVLAGVVAGAAAATLHFHPVSAADDCLSKPKGTAPAGQHWYYRSDRATKKQCWYLGDEASRGASLNERKSAAAVAHRHHQEFSQAAVDAHAEFASPGVPATNAKNSVVAAVAPTPVEPSPIAAAAPTPVPALAAADSAAADSAATTPAPDNVTGSADQSAVASRWPDATAAQPTAVPSRNPGTYAVAAADPAPAAAATVDSSLAAATPADSSATDSESPSMTAVGSTIDSSRTRLAAFLGAVALAGFSTSVLLARARARRRIRLEPAGGRRRQIWPADAEIDHMQLPDVDGRQATLATRSEPARPRTARLSIVPRDEPRYDEQYEVEDLLARYGGQGRSKH